MNSWNDFEFNECISRTIKFSSKADIVGYSIIVSKNSFYFFYDRCGESRLTEINKNLEIVIAEENVPRNIFGSNSFIASNKLFSFQPDPPFPCASFILPSWHLSLYSVLTSWHTYTYEHRASRKNGTNIF